MTELQSIADRLGLTRSERMQLAALDQFAHAMNRKEPAVPDQPTNDEQTVVLVYPTPWPSEAIPVRYRGADDFAVNERGDLSVYDPRQGESGEVAVWAPGTWQRVEIVTEPAAEPAAADTPDTAHGVIEIHPDSSDGYCWRLIGIDGERLATGQRYRTRAAARQAAAAMQTAAVGASIIDVQARP